MATTFHSFLESHRCDKTAKDWNLTGLLSGVDLGKFKVNDDEYDTFLRLVHGHIFARPARACSLLERHRDTGPLLIDLDFRYNAGGPLTRKFVDDNVRRFVADYVAAMVYFSRVEDLTEDPVFWHLEKPSPEKDKDHHKDGIHIHCANITTPPRYQYGIRGFLLQNEVIPRVFEGQGISNPPEDVYDVAVIFRNNWFLYGACKIDKAQYKAQCGWRLPIAEVKDALDGGDPEDFTELSEIVYNLLQEVTPIKDNLEMMKTLSIRRNHNTATPLVPRTRRAAEWEDIIAAWGSGKKNAENTTQAHNAGIGADPTEGAEDIPAKTGEDQLIVTDVGAAIPANEEDIQLAYRFCKDCINAEKRCGEYQDWINMAICLKNINNTDESYKAWVDLTRRTGAKHKKSTYTDSALRTKWNLVRIDDSRKLSMASLNYWAREDNDTKWKSIMSECHTRWILNLGKDTHVSVASFVKRFFKHEFRCSYGARRSAEWYHFGKHTHAWKYLKAPVIIRSSLSEVILTEYWEAEKMAGDKWRASEDSASKDAWDAKKKKISKITNNLETTTFKDHVLKECGEKFYDEEFINRLNTNTSLVGVMNGVLDLRYLTEDGSQHVMFRPGLPDDNISFQMGRSGADLDAISYEVYIPETPTPQQKLVLEFFERIYPDAVLREYVLTLLAACLEGGNPEQKFYVMQGVGSNGKSMIEKLMEQTFGDYGTSISTTTFTRKRADAGNANPDVITVKCRRFLHCGEPDDNEKINCSVMKAWTGGDQVPARGLFSDQEKFVIQGKIFMSCNDLPPIQKMDDGTWRRIRVIPHTSIFKDPGNPMIDPSKHIYEKDLALDNKLRTWRVGFLGILVWYFENKYLRTGLKEPSCVSAASDKYKEEFDMFMQFFNETYVTEPNAGPVTVKDFRIQFTAWSKAQGKQGVLTASQALDRMTKMIKPAPGGKEFWGIRLALDGEDISGGGPAVNELVNMP